MVVGWSCVVPALPPYGTGTGRAGNVPRGMLPRCMVKSLLDGWGPIFEGETTLMLPQRYCISISSMCICIEKDS